MSTAPARFLPEPNGGTLALIRALGRILDDLERERIMTTNRIGALEREHGEALPHLHYVVAPLLEAEHRAVLELKRAWRKHPLAPWAKSVPGCGEKIIARLIAEIGDPADRPNVAKLWAYCGHGDPARKRARGMSQEELFRLGNPIAKKRAWLVGAQFVKTLRSPYRDVYVARRAATVDRVHATICARCGPAGHPATPGSPWSLAHQHADAIRFTTKDFLRDLWIEAVRLREDT